MSSMRVVPRPSKRPMRCAAIPFIGQTHQTARWIDTGAEMEFSAFDNRVYLSDIAVLEAARLLGFPSRGEHRMVLEERDDALEQVTGLMEELAEARRLLGAVETLRAAGFAVGEVAA